MTISDKLFVILISGFREEFKTLLFFVISHDLWRV